MKKRILSIALTVALLFSLIPLGAIPASAASDFKASQEMIDILKKWEGFSKHPYWDYSQWTVGYGTRAPSDKLAEYKKNGIPEDEAEALLQQFLESMGKSLNSFIDKYGLTMTQSQFDALLSLCYNCGTSWLFKPSTLRTSVIEGWTGDDLLFAFAQWSNSGDTTITGLIRRRLAEANMYLNGIYAVSAPADYCYVQFDANGGESEIVVQGYDKDVVPEIRAVPTYDNYTFLGWYTDPTGGEKVTKLDKTVSGYTLYAHWKAGGSSGSQDTEITGTTVSYERLVATGTLNSFDQPVKGALVVDAYPNGEMVQIVAEYTDADGVVWGKVSGGAWINLSYTIDPNDDGAGAVDVTVTVTGNSVNLRRGPSTSYASVGQVDAGVELRITQTASGGGYLWGKSARGWIALKYTNYDSVINGGSKEEAPEQKPEEKPEQKPEDTTPDTGSGTASDAVATGKVVLQSGKLNVRSGPSTGYSVVGYLKNGDAVEILEKKTVGATVWGKTAKGWISLNYVKLDSQSSAETPKEPESSNTNTGSNTGSSTENNSTSSGSVTGKIVLQSGRLNIRSGPGTGYSVVGWLSAGDQVTITERRTVNGTTWGKISRGWISMNYVSVASGSNTGSTGSTNTGTGSSNSGNTGSADNSADSSKAVTGKVSADGSKLRIRSGPGSSYSIAGYLSDGSSVEILERKTVGATTWGRIAKGWISLNYVELDSASTGSADSSADTGATTGTVIADCLNVRAGAGTGYKIVARLYTGEKVTILETKEVNGTTWGRISSGWICMDYIK